MRKNNGYKYILLSLIMLLGLFFSTFKVESLSKNETRTAIDPSPILYAGAMDTGAASASRDYKGGIIFLEPNTQYTMKGGTYSGGNKTYGGAVYISEGATFTMDGGTITNCKATYGGGIYVRAGATCNILSGSITNCSATYGPAIFVEDGGILNIEDGVDIDENDIMIDKVQVSSDKIQVGDTDSTLYLHYMEFGNYPQTYVGNTLNAELESWYNSTKPQSVATYATDTNTNSSQGFLGKGKTETAHGASESWDVWISPSFDRPTFVGYEYKGEIYARGVSDINYSSYNRIYFKNGTEIMEKTTYWFRVEPIKWAVLNYDEWKAGAKLKLMSMISLMGEQQRFSEWATSDTRSWLNNEFLNSAFTEKERKNIILTTLQNDSSSSSTTGVTTEDYVYIYNREEMMDSSVFPTNHSRVCSSSDFVLCLYTDYYEFYGCVNKKISTTYRTDSMHYMLRTTYSSMSGVMVISPSGVVDEHHPCICYPVRPFITLNI